MQPKEMQMLPRDLLRSFESCSLRQISSRRYLASYLASSFGCKLITPACMCVLSCQPSLAETHMPSPFVRTDGQTSLRVPRVQVRPLLFLQSRACNLNSIVSDASIDLVAQSLGISRIEAADCICGHCETAAVALTGALRSSLTCPYHFSEN